MPYFGHAQPSTSPTSSDDGSTPFAKRDRMTLVAVVREALEACLAPQAPPGL